MDKCAWEFYKSLPASPGRECLHGSRQAADYAGVSFSRGVMAVMLLSGGLAGLAGAVEVLGVHFR
ncbi:MAG: hypothetical protein ABIR70_13275, partial [Bryobacteraceae bacterium]